MSDRPGIDVVYQENRALEAEIEHLRSRVEELEDSLAVMDANQGGKYYITEEQIDAAWKYAYGPYHCYLLCSDEAIHTLKLVGIVECEECGGSGVKAVPRGHVTGQCPDCHGHGWVWKEASDE